MFAPKWKKEAKLLIEGASKFVNYKRDLLRPERVDEIESRREDLLAAIKAGDRAKSDEASKQLRATCENALPQEKPVGWFEETVEVIFVAIVIILGLRAYYLQPFRIPTGSMMPTLNGIVGHKKLEAEWPALPKRVMEQITRGRSYVKVVLDSDRKMAVAWDRQDGYRPQQLEDYQWCHFFSRSTLYFTDSDPMLLPGPATQMLEIGLREACTSAQPNNNHVVTLKRGTVLCEGYLDTGDLVLVDKVSYHFRKPKRGEVFVFDTRGIRGIDQAKGTQHYIKRLCGVPGDTLTIQSPDLLVDGKIAKEFGIQRVIRGEGAYAINPKGYELAGASQEKYLSKLGDSLTLASKARTGMREYAALGDNTRNSADSRYWGTVKEFNLVGPALFSLWPFTTGHWGFID